LVSFVGVAAPVTVIWFGARPAGATANICVAIDGVVRHQSGTASCAATGR
jgi:hypothetical protein